MSNQVVTIGYLKDFVNGKLTVSTDMPDTYCPTYGELTGGALVPNYEKGANPKDTVNGIDIPDCTVDIGYTSEQLVIRQDLLLKYMVLDEISIKADSTEIDKCGGETDICVTGTFHLVTKSEDDETDGSAETDTSILVTWSGDADDAGPSTCTVISFGLNAVGNIGTDNPTSAPERTESTTATYTYKGTNLTSDNDTTKTSNTVTITQGANNVGEWYYEGSTDYGTSLVIDCPSEYISENGGSITVTSILYYEQDWRCDDECENTVGYKYLSSHKTGPEEIVEFEEQECDAEERTKTVNLSMSGQTDSCVVTQEASSVPCYCGQSCGDVGCDGKIHWLCAEKKDTTQYDYDCSTAKVLNLNDKGQLPSSGGTASATVDGKSKKGIWTKSAYCSTESLPTQIVDSLPNLSNAESSQNTVYLLVNKEGGTGGTLYYNDSDGDTQSTYSYTYTSYTQYHYTVWPEDVQIGKKTIKEEKWGWKVLGTSYKREANSVTSYESTRYRYSCYSANGCDDKREEFINDGNSASSWDNAYSSWYTKWEKYQASEKFYCDGSEVPSEEEMLNCEGEQERKLDESLNPGEFYIYGYYYAPTTVYGDGTDSEMNRVSTCCVRNISTEKDYLVEHLSTPTDITTTATFTYQANTGATEIKGTATLTLSGGRTCNVSYKVAPGSTATDNCATVKVSGRDWTLTLANAAESDVTYKFDAKNGYMIGTTKGDDWEQTVTVSKGNKEGTARSNTTQHATGATLVSVSPTIDAKYNYNCISNIECEGFDDVYELVVTKEIVAETASVEEYMSVTSKKNGAPYKDFTFSENCSWVTNFQILNPNDADGVYNVQITLEPNSDEGSRTCNGSVVQTNGKTETFSIVQSGNSSGGDNTGDCILGTTSTMQGGTGSKITLETGKNTTVTIYSIDETGRCTTTPSREIGDTNIISSCVAGSLSDVTCSNVWTILAGSKTGSTNITFTNGCETFILPIEVTGGSQEETSCYGLYVVCDRTKNRFKYDFNPLTQTDLTLKVTFYNNGSEIGTYTNELIPQGMSGSDWLTLTFDITNCDDFSVTQLTENSRGDDYNMLCDGQSTCVFEDSTEDCTCSVTSINVTPSEYTFTSSGSAYFDVLLIDNDCSGCTNGWSIYKGSTFVKSGTSSSFSMSSDSDGEYTIKSNDNTNKVGKFTLTKYSPPAPTTYSCKINYVNNTSETSKTAIVNLITTGLTAGQSKTLTLIGSNGSVDVTDTKAITWCVDSVTNTNNTNSAMTYSYTLSNGGGCFSLTTNGNEVTITISDSTPTPTPCSCSVTSISVSPSTHTFTNCGSAYFTVTIDDNDCSGCTNQFLVYNSSGTYVTSGISTFSLSNQTGTFTIKAKDNQNKTCTLTTTACTASTSITWSSISVTNVSADKCDEYASMTVTANGTKTNSNCCTASTSTTLTSSNYTVKYGKTDGSYTLDKIEKNETTSEVTWYYKVTASSTYGSKTATGSFKQASGKCTPDSVYVMQKTSTDTSTSITFPGGTTYLPYPGYICCYSTKDGVKQSVTTSSDSTWLTVSENNDLPYDGANYNFKFDQTENTSTTSRTGKITITQSGSNKKVVWTIVQGGKPNYVFKFNNPTGGFDSTSTETNIIHNTNYEPIGPTTTLTSTKDGSNVGYTMSSNVNWITTSTASTTCSWTISKNTSTSSRSGTITLKQSGSNKTLTISVTQGGAPATCDCSTVSISCNPSNSYTTGNSVSTIVTVNAGSNCSTKWKAYSSSGSYLGEGESGKSLSRTTTGTVTFRSDACSGKTTTWTISKPECAKPTIRLSGSGDAYMLQSYSDTDEWCGTNPNVSVSTSADYIGDGSDNTHYSPTTCSFEIANCGASITSFNLDSGGWILESYSGLNSFGIGFTIRPDAIVNATCVLSGTFTYLMQGTPFSGTFSISIQFNG